MAKFQQAVTVIPADWANAVDNLVFGVLQQAKSVDDIKAVLEYAAQQSDRAVLLVS